VQRLLDRAAIHDTVVSSALALDGNDERTRHFLNNQLVTIDGDEAAAQTYAYVTERRPDGTQSPWSQGARRWVDRLRRVDGGWTIVNREVQTTRLTDEMVITADEAARRARPRTRNGERRWSS
jgi:hypothetical protein